MSGLSPSESSVQANMNEKREARRDRERIEKKTEYNNKIEQKHFKCINILLWGWNVGLCDFDSMIIIIILDFIQLLWLKDRLFDDNFI